MTRALSLLLLASILNGCAGTTPPNTLTVFNRTQDKVTLELLPHGHKDPTTSPLYQKHTLEPRSHAEVEVVSAYYSLRAVQDDWEREIRRRIDRRITEDGTLTIEPGCRLTFEETPDPLLDGRDFD